MSGRGHRASLPAGGHARPEYLVADERGAVVVRHCNREGRVREYDFSQLPAAGPMRASLAALFAARCTPDRWAVHATSMGAWLLLRQFAEFLARQQRPPRDLDELTPALVRQWRESLPAAAAGYRAWRSVSGMLRDDARLQAGPVADELARRYKIPPSKVQSYTEAEFDRVTAAARRQFRAALRRISDNAAHLEQWREGAFARGTRDWTAGEGLDALARTGDLPRYYSATGSTIKGKYIRAFGGPDGTVTWRRLFLTREEAVALSVLLLAEFGWNLSVIDTLEVPREAPDQGDDGRPTYRVPLEKPRRGPGRHRETRNVTDDGARLARAADHPGPEGHAFRPRRCRGTRSRHRQAARLADLQARPAAHGPGPAPAGQPVLPRRPQQQRDSLGEGRGAERKPVPARAPHGGRARPARACPAFPGHP